ncbi:MAG TPA: hydantoinase/oxoprolinase family protein, partial [Acetobacteraceae bacterium]|nr:hydantoinase/oxoprolinase family protein [Acetobacteraceae bacterium]
ADFATTRLTRLAPEALAPMRAAFARLSARAEEWFAEEGIAAADRRLARRADLRYVGQNYELPVALPDGGLDDSTLAALAEGFMEEHRRMYGFAADDEPIELVTFRVEATGLVQKAEFAPQPDRGPDPSEAIIGAREVWLPEAGGLVRCPVYDRERLAAGNRIAGPAIVEQMDATTLLLPDMVAQVDPWANLMLEAA